MASSGSGLDEPPAEDLADDRLVRYETSMYGGRPTFAIIRRETDSGGEWTLYELLPEEQGEARRTRLQRAGRSLQLTPVEELLLEPPDADLASTSEGWPWEEWVGAKVARLDPTRVRAVQDVVRESMDETPADADSILSGGDGCAFLPESAGVRLAVAFRGVKPIQRIDRMRSLARGVARMSSEECYYWYAKCRAPSSPNGEKALRVLLTDHID
jgi:hypothetical protein